MNHFSDHSHYSCLLRHDKIIRQLHIILVVLFFILNLVLAVYYIDALLDHEEIAKTSLFCCIL